MLSTSVDDDTILYEYMNSDHPAGKFIQAPNEIRRNMGNHSVGLLFEYVSDEDVLEASTPRNTCDLLEMEKPIVASVAPADGETRSSRPSSATVLNGRKAARKSSVSKMYVRINNTAGPNEIIAEVIGQYGISLSNVKTTDGVD